MKQLATLTLSLLCLFVTAQNDRRIIAHESIGLISAWPYTVDMGNNYTTDINKSQFLDANTRFKVIDTLAPNGKDPVYVISLVGYKTKAIKDFETFVAGLEKIGILGLQPIKKSDLQGKFAALPATTKTELDALLGEVYTFQQFFNEYEKYYIEEYFDATNNVTMLRFITDYKNYVTTYIVKQEKFAKYSKPIYALHEFSLGVITIPIKVRFGGDSVNGRLFDFGADASLGLNFGYKLNFSRYVKDAGSFNIMSGVSITALQVTPETTKGKVAEKTMVAAITIPFGVVFELPKTGNGLQLGVFTGLDFIAGNLYKNWSYSNKPWLSFGLSYNLLDRSGGKENPGKNTN